MWSCIALLWLYCNIIEGYITSKPQIVLSKSVLRASDISEEEVSPILNAKIEVEQCDVASEGTVDCQPRHTYVKPKTTVWSVFGALAASTGAANLGQGKSFYKEQV